MRKLFAILFVFLILLQGSIKTLIVAEYYIDYNYIVSEVCENRDNPDAHCDGKCYLKKQMATEEKAERRSGASVKEKTETLFIEASAVPVTPDYEPYKQLYTAYLLKPSFAFSASVFHPPPIYVIS